MRSLKNNILKIKKIKKRIRSLRYYKIKNLYEINSKITILKSNKDFFLLRLNIKIINKKDILKAYLIIQIMLGTTRYTIESLIKKKIKFNVYHYNIKHIIY